MKNEKCANCGHLKKEHNEKSWNYAEHIWISPCKKCDDCFDFE